jgi:hypothetical protein
VLNLSRIKLFYYPLRLITNVGTPPCDRCKTDACPAGSHACSAGDSTRVQRMMKHRHAGVCRMTTRHAVVQYVCASPRQCTRIRQKRSSGLRTKLSSMYSAWPAYRTPISTTVRLDRSRSSVTHRRSHANLRSFRFNRLLRICDAINLERWPTPACNPIFCILYK